MFKIILSPQAEKDIIKLERYGPYHKFNKLIEKIRENPYAQGDNFEKVKGCKKTTYSRRINDEHRLVYRVDDEIITIIIVQAWSHYESMKI